MWIKVYHQDLTKEQAEKLFEAILFFLDFWFDLDPQQATGGVIYDDDEEEAPDGEENTG